MKIHLHLLLLLAVMLATNCSSHRKKALGSKVHLDYEVSTQDVIYSSDLFIGEFMDVIKKHPPRSSTVPKEVLSCAERESQKLKSRTVITDVQRKVNMELIHFHLLDRYLLPAYQNSGDVVIEDRILQSLIQLKDQQSSSEIYLQVKSLHAISQGGFYYPELQKHLSSIISQKLSHSGQDNPQLQKANDMLSDLEARSIH